MGRLHLEVILNTESDHFPLGCKLSCTFQEKHDLSTDLGSLSRKLYSWSPNDSDQFRENSVILQLQLHQSGHLISQHFTPQHTEIYD